MPTYTHLQDVKKAETLPQAEGEQIGVCLTCQYWHAPTPRPVSETMQIALCVQHQLKEYALVVSGSSGCNKWVKSEEAGTDAENYAHQTQA